MENLKKLNLKNKVQRFKSIFKLQINGDLVKFRKIEEEFFMFIALNERIIYQVDTVEHKLIQTIVFNQKIVKFDVYANNSEVHMVALLNNQEIHHTVQNEFVERL